MTFVRPAALLRRGALALTDLVFPPRCGLCGVFGPFVCAMCVAALPHAGGGRCPLCAARATFGDCRDCAAAAGGGLDGTIAATRYEAGARRLVHRLKYDRLSALAAPMAELMAETLATAPPVDVVVPVPLHPRRERDRGFNQSALLAREIASRLGIDYAPRALERVRRTSPQAREPDSAARARNVAGAFAPRQPVVGRAVLLVDDVMTTGATLRACATVLREGGARAVYATVFARD